MMHPQDPEFGEPGANIPELPGISGHESMSAVIPAEERAARLLCANTGWRMSLKEARRRIANVDAVLAPEVGPACLSSAAHANYRHGQDSYMIV